MKTLKLTPNTSKVPSSEDTAHDVADFVCPLNLKEMNGSQPFVFLWTCGCVFSHAGLRAVSSTPPPREESESVPDVKGPEVADGKQLDICPQCAAKYDKARDIIMLNPPPEEEEKMYAAMLLRRASEPAKTKGKKRKADSAPDPTADPAAKKRAHTSSAPSINGHVASASRKVAIELATEEARRKSQMSDAVKSLYLDKGAQPRKETFMTMGTFTRVRLPVVWLTFFLIRILQYA